MNLDLFRSFFEIVEQGSLSKAAERLRVSQSTLTRQVHALEHEIGGAVFERSASGVALTATGHALVASMRPVLVKFDAAIAEARRLARGKSAIVRIGYLMSAAADFLNPALVALHRGHPEVKVKLLDLSPGEQIVALRQGEIDLALIGRADGLVAREFYVRKIASMPVFVAMSGCHPLAGATSVRLGDLHKDLFVGAPDSDMPGYNRWIVQTCRRAGFRPRFVEEAGSLTDAVATVVSEGAVTLLPEYATRMPLPGMVCRPLDDAHVRWDFFVAWQRGRLTAPVRQILEALEESSRS